MTDTIALPPDEARTMALISGTLQRRLQQQGRNAIHVPPDADLVELGLVDSQALLDVILEVEQASGYLFNADRIDFETGMTLRHLAAAFCEAD